MKLRNIRKTGRGFTGFGAMWKKGELKPSEMGKVSVLSEDGAPVPAQSRITAFYPDGSVKWTAHLADAKKLGRVISVEKGKKAAPTFDGIKETESEEGLLLETGYFNVYLSYGSDTLFKCVKRKNKTVWEDARLVLSTVEPTVKSGNKCEITHDFTGKIKEISFEEEGPVAYVIKYEGVHTDKSGREAFPFVVRMRIGLNSDEISFTHTFLYDGDENRDFLKSMGIEMKVHMDGELYNRHVKFEEEHGVFHEALVHLTSWRPRLPMAYLETQMAGRKVKVDSVNAESVAKVMEATPYWDEYVLTQSESNHFDIKKKLAGDELCYIDAFTGSRTDGAAALGSTLGSTVFTIRDFWEKYPSGYTFKGLTGGKATCTAWFYAPDAKPFDFRHYATRGYNQVCYEGYDYKGATPDGIAVTSECTVSFCDKLIPSDAELSKKSKEINEPALYVASPEDYHELKAFGYWSLPLKGTETGEWIEKELDKAFTFYKNEVEQRNWYGLFNYGDFMHTYDPVRHTWKYDMGGYAWDNTELVPTLWLWIYFMRTGREDVYTLAEKLSRHASEVDVYHFGIYKGLGSRHNVRHWGCPCKEARIAMAGHHRYMYYLTGDRRLEDIFDELKDNELSFLNKDPLGDFFEKSEMVYPSHARSGPDWSSLVSNWMTEWERHNDNKYRDKIITGLNDIKAAPLKLSSGPDFEFDPKTVHLRYIGERTTGGTHLQVCMGAPSIWTETADLLEDEEFKRMIAEHGRFYFLSHEEQLKESGGIIGNRQSTLPMLSCSMGAYGAKYFKDKELALTTWKILLETMLSNKDVDTGFTPKTLKNRGGKSKLKEISWISTNFTAQWCLNTIITAEFIEEYMPKTLKEARKLVSDTHPERLHVS